MKFGITFKLYTIFICGVIFLTSTHLYTGEKVPSSYNKRVLSYSSIATVVGLCGYAGWYMWRYIDDIKYLLKAIKALKKDVKDCIDKDHDQETGGGTFLWYAAQQGYGNTLRMLVQKKELIDEKNRRGETPLYGALQQKQIASIKLLLQENADVHALTKTGQTLFEAACALQDQKIKENIIQLLLHHKFDINKCYMNKGTLMHTAALNNQTELITLLLHYKADLNVYERYFTPLQSIVALYAQVSQEERLSTIKLLLSNSMCDINACSRNGYAPLHVAVVFCKPDLVSLLLDYKADCNTVDRDHNTPLYLAVIQQDLQKEKYLEIVSLLLKAQCNATIRNNRGFTPLYGAVAYNFVEAVALLLQYDLHGSTKDLQGITPLMRAIMVRTSLHKSGELRKNMGIIKLFLENRCSLYEQNNEGLSPLHFGVLSNDESVVNILIEYGAQVNAQTNKVWGTIPYYNATPLVFACYKKNPIMVKMLLRAGAKQDILCRSYVGVVEYSPYAVALYGECKASMELLLEDQAIKKKFKVGILKGFLCREINIKPHVAERIYTICPKEKNYHHVKYCDISRKDAQVLWFMRQKIAPAEFPPVFLLSKLKKNNIFLGEQKFWMPHIKIAREQDVKHMSNNSLHSLPNTIHFNPKKRLKPIPYIKSKQGYSQD